MELHLKIQVKVNGNEFTIDVEPVVCSDTRPRLNFVNTPYVPAKGDKYYFLPGVNIPRIKLKDLAIQHGVKTVRNIDDATHIFGGNGTIDKMTTTSWFHFTETKDFLDFVDLVKDYIDDYYMEKITQAFEFYTLDKVIIQNDVYSILKYHVPVSHPLCHEIQSCKLADSMHRNTSYGYVPDEHNLQLLNIIINKEIYNEDALLAHLNGPDAVTIDETMYEQIAGMFASSDADNHVLAMEIMANCKYKESLLYLEFLFKEYSDVMYSTHTKNHVNFKSLLSYLGKNHSMSTSIDTIINCLIDKGVLDVEKVNIIMNRYHSQISERGDSAFFKVKTITLHDETLALLNANYTYTVQEDFEPIEVIEEIEAVLESIETNSAEEEALALEDASFFSESELNEIEKGPEPESNNHQIEEKDETDSFEWF